MTKKNKIVVGSIIGGVVVLGAIGSASGGSDNDTSSNLPFNSESSYISTVESDIADDMSSLVISATVESLNVEVLDVSQPETVPAPADTTAATTIATPAPQTTPATTTTATVTTTTAPPATEPTQSNEITLVSMTNPLRRNEDATITIQGAPNTEYQIAVYYSSGKSTAEGLENKYSDSNGIVSWAWHVGGKTNLGDNKRIKITGGGKTYETTFSVVD